MNFSNSQEHLLNSPHGGTLRDLMVVENERERLFQELVDLPSIEFSDRQLCDPDLILCGAFSSLESFLSRRDYESVLESLRLADGTVLPIPVMLAVSAAEGGETGRGKNRGPQGSRG